MQAFYFEAVVTRRDGTFEIVGDGGFWEDLAGLLAWADHAWSGRYQYQIIHISHPELRPASCSRLHYPGGWHYTATTEKFRADVALYKGHLFVRRHDGTEPYAEKCAASWDKDNPKQWDAKIYRNSHWGVLD